MKLVMKPAAWSSLGDKLMQHENNIVQYQVEDLPRTTIDATTTAQAGTTWTITRNGSSTGKYGSAQEALNALESGAE
jgi:hypothetical protein